VALAQRHQSRIRKEPVLGKSNTTHVGLDAHKVAIMVAVLLPGESRPVEWQISNDAAAVRTMVSPPLRMLGSNLTAEQVGPTRGQAGNNGGL
jgi:hypothetical protein